MDGYKKFIKSQRVRMEILKFLSFVPDKYMLKLQYWIKLRRKLNLEEPERYTEKIQWYKLYYRNELMTHCVDKYEVRRFVESRGYKSNLVELYGVYTQVDDIDFSKLPDKFVIKTTNGSGTNFICDGKRDFDDLSCKRKISEFMKRPTISSGREWAYYDVQNKIIVEEFLEDEGNIYGGINDYKFICFNGEIHCIVVDVGRYTEHRRNFYDLNWNLMNVSSDHENIDDIIEKPQNFEEMKKMVMELSKGFPHVRVDLYNIKGNIYFGEMTFYPWSGYVEFEPDEFDFVLGEKFVISEV